ncbi:MAG: nucleotidyltransferase domain-containing protein [Planctomycetes bacterium]|nr:nucleotidyltransferase domain-containing protein [Planctomycetota bacterium]
MSLDEITMAVRQAAGEFPLRRVALFGSQANGTADEGSDVDLIVEFTEPVTLLTLARVKEFLEGRLHRSVDVIHGPLQNTDMLEIGKEIEIYAA